MGRSFKSKILKTYAKLGFCLGSLGLFGGPTQQAQAQDAPQKNRNLFTTEVGAEHYAIPALGLKGTFLTGRAAIIFGADQKNASRKKSLTFHPIVAANYTHGVHVIPPYNVSYSNAISKGFFASTGGYFVTQRGVTVEMGAGARLEHGPLLTISSHATAHVPVWRTGLHGVGGNIRTEAKLNLWEIENASGDHNATFYLKAFHTLGMQRTLLLNQNFGTPFEEVGFAPYKKAGITFGAKF